MPVRILYDFGTIKTRTQGRRMGVFTAQPASYAAINNRRYRINFEGIGIVFQCESRTR